MNRAQIALSDRFGSIKIVHSKRNQTLPMHHIWLVPIIAVSFGDCRLFGRHWAKLLLHQCDVIKWMDGECPFTPPLVLYLVKHLDNNKSIKSGLQHQYAGLPRKKNKSDKVRLVSFSVYVWA
ncbi:hypothetical protein BLOT_000066 [Blomia tropicalis]|nr:hypothetical protein BLOT_000066 [Blomia tropicalis]